MTYCHNYVILMSKYESLDRHNYFDVNSDVNVLHMDDIVVSTYFTLIYFSITNAHMLGNIEKYK